MTDTAPETQTCPFCYTEMDARADVCPNCLATKDTTPEWAKRLKVYWSAVVVIFIGLALTFIADAMDGRPVLSNEFLSLASNIASRRLQEAARWPLGYMCCRLD